MSYENDLLTAHLEKVKSRIQAEDLSMLELRLRVTETRTRMADEGLSGEARAMATAEAEMLGRLVEEAAPPPETPVELLARLRESGQVDKADQLEHGMKTTAAQIQYDDLFSQQLGTAPADPRYAELGEQMKAAKLAISRTKSETPPALQRQADERARRDEAIELRSSANELRDGDPTRERVADTLDAQADALAQA